MELPSFAKSVWNLQVFKTLRVELTNFANFACGASRFFETLRVELPSFAKFVWNLQVFKTLRVELTKFANFVWNWQVF